MEEEKILPIFLTYKPNNILILKEKQNRKRKLQDIIFDKNIS